eukprot:g6386.t1
MVFDINPADPAVISLLVGVACMLLAAAVCFRNTRKSQRRSGGGVAEEKEEEEQQQHEGQAPGATVASRPRYNTRGHRVASPPGGGESSPRKEVTPQQAALCEVLYDVYAGVVPARGIDSRTVRECDLSTAELRRQFKNIKQAREAAGSLGGASRGSRPSTRLATAATKLPQPSPGKPASRRLAAAAAATASPKKSLMSPTRTPVKRGGASRPAPASPPRSGKRSVVSPSPSKAKVSALPSPSPSASRLRAGQSPLTSPVSTRSKASASVGSPKCTPIKRAAAPVGGGGNPPSFSSPRSAGGTPSKRGKPSVLEIARREAQQMAADVASTRASNLRSHASSARKGRTKS